MEAPLLNSPLIAVWRVAFCGTLGGGKNMSEDFKNTFSWSKSRDSLFKECPRKYYYNYYGYWDGWSRDSSEKKKRLNYLKRLRTKEIWMGEKVHEVIEHVLRMFRDGEKIGLGHAIAIFRRKMYSELAQSLAKGYTGFHSKIMKLFEHEYDIGLSDPDFNDIVGRGERCIENFYNSDTFIAIRRTPLKDWMFLEDFLNFDFEEVCVYLSIDFALRKDGKIILYDWKTGRERLLEFDMQMTLYSLFVTEKFDINPEDIVAKVYNLNIDKEDEFVIDEEKMIDIKRYMRKSIMEMREVLVDVGENIAKEEDFLCEEGFGCSRCNFRKVCFGEW